VLTTGWGGLAAADVPPGVSVADAVPHDLLFSRVASVVHHGGAGTTAAGLRAGKPTVICPFLGDQGFWGRRVATLGARPAPIPQRRLTVDGLTAALRAAATDLGMRTRAATLGVRVRAEQGVERAVGVIVAHLASRPAASPDV